MKIKVDTAGLKNSKWYEFALRFSFGGAVTAFAGLIAKRYGPEVGGVFLAFPAIVPATATLIRKREQQKKERAGYDGAERGRAAAAVDVAGAAIGGFGLIAFSLVVWLTMREWKTPVVLAVATAVWFWLHSPPGNSAKCSAAGFAPTAPTFSPTLWSPRLIANPCQDRH